MPLFRDEGAMRQAVRTLSRVFGSRLVLFSFGDDHGHVTSLVTEGQVARTGSTLLRAMKPLVQSPLAPPYARPVENRKHLIRLVPYFVGQTEHHRLPAHPALWSGSCFQDLVGARCITGTPLRLWDLLPRERPDSLLAKVGLPPGPLEPAPDHVVRGAGARRIVLASAAATAAPPELIGRSDPVCTARRAAAILGDEVRLTRAEMAWALDVTPRALRRIPTQAVDRRVLSVRPRGPIAGLAAPRTSTGPPSRTDRAAHHGITRAQSRNSLASSEGPA